MTRKIIVSVLCATFAAAVMPLAQIQAAQNSQIDNLWNQFSQLKNQIINLIGQIKPVQKQTPKPQVQESNDKKIINGTISSAPTGSSFSLTGETKTITVNYTATTTIMFDGAATTANALAQGLKAYARGVMTDSKNLTASEIGLLSKIATGEDDENENQENEDEKNETGGYLTSGLQQLFNRFEKNIRAEKNLDAAPLAANYIALNGVADSIDAAAEKIAVKAYGFNYAVDATGAKIVAAGNKPLEFSKINAGDKLTVVGELTDSTNRKISAAVVRDNSKNNPASLIVDAAKASLLAAAGKTPAPDVCGYIWRGADELRGLEPFPGTTELNKRCRASHGKLSCGYYGSGCRPGIDIPCVLFEIVCQCNCR